MRFKVSEVNCLVHFSSQIGAVVALYVLASHFLWQVKYLQKKNNVHLETFQAQFHSTEI